MGTTGCRGLSLGFRVFWFKGFGDLGLGVSGIWVQDVQPFP